MHEAKKHPFIFFEQIICILLALEVWHLWTAICKQNKLLDSLGKI